MEKMFKKMVSDFKRELVKDFKDGKITEGKYEELVFAVDNMVNIYYKDIDISEMIRLLHYFQTAYVIMK